MSRPVEVPLSGGEPSVRGSALVNGQVHPSTGPWTPAVHALLRHPGDVGFDGWLRVIGFDGRGREVTTSDDSFVTPRQAGAFERLAPDLDR